MVTATQVEAEARRRADRLAGRGLIEGDAEFLVAGTIIGSLGLTAADILEETVDPDDVFVGQRAASITFTRAIDVVARAS